MALPSNITVKTSFLTPMTIPPTGPVALVDANGNMSVDLALTPTVNPDHTVQFGNGPTSGPWIGWISAAAFRAGLLNSVYTLSGPAVYPIGG